MERGIDGLLTGIFLKIVLASATLVATVTAATAAETAKGRVFNDHNHNGRLDAGEPGIAGVRVSDGEQIVLTDSEGAYELDVDAPVVIRITKPSGYATPVNEHQLPQVYYIHQPDGSPPGMRYLGVEPTGPLPNTINAEGFFSSG